MWFCVPPLETPIPFSFRATAQIFTCPPFSPDPPCCKSLFGTSLSETAASFFPFYSLFRLCFLSQLSAPAPLRTFPSPVRTDATNHFVFSGVRSLCVNVCPARFQSGPLGPYLCPCSLIRPGPRYPVPLTPTPVVTASCLPPEVRWRTTW